MNDEYIYKFFHINSKNYMSQVLNASAKAYDIDIEGKKYPITSTYYSHNVESKGTITSSCRNFMKSDLVSINEMLTILKESYLLESKGDSHVNSLTPSAGGLYPIEIYIITSERHPQAGTYHYSKTKGELNFIRPIIEFNSFLTIGNSFLENSSFLIIMTAKMENLINKYGARGYRYALIEAGHIGQNISRFVSETPNLGCCAIGGFFDDVLHKKLNLPVNELPIYIYGIGKKVF